MEDYEVEKLIEEAHQIFSKTSIFEVIDLDPVTAIMMLVDYYGPTHKDSLDKYLSILDQLRIDEGADNKKELTCEEYICLMGFTQGSCNQVGPMNEYFQPQTQPNHKRNEHK